VLSVAVEIGTATPLRQRMLVHDRNLYKIDHSSFQGESARLPQDAPEVQDRPAAIATAIVARWVRRQPAPNSSRRQSTFEPRLLCSRNRSRAWVEAKVRGVSGLLGRTENDGTSDTNSPKRIGKI
jgi:hypothetical protein